MNLSFFNLITVPVYSASERLSVIEQVNVHTYGVNLPLVRKADVTMHIQRFQETYPAFSLDKTLSNLGLLVVRALELWIENEKVIPVEEQAAILTEDFNTSLQYLVNAENSEKNPALKEVKAARRVAFETAGESVWRKEHRFTVSDVVAV